MNPMDPGAGSRLGSKVELTAAWLRRGMAVGRWQDRLPGLRVLAMEAGVSTGTLTLALQVLSREGLVSAPGPRQRFRILGKAVGAPGPNRVLLILVPKTVGHRASVDHWYLGARLNDRLAPKGWVTRMHMLPPASDKGRLKHCDRLLHFENPDAVVAFLGDESLARWARQRGVRLYFIGGLPGNEAVPTIGVSVSAMLEQSLDVVLAAGHRRVVFPMQCRQTAFVNAMRKVFSTRYQTAGAGRSLRLVRQIPEIPEPGTAAFARVARRLISQWKPTAWICLDWHEFLWIKREYECRGIRIPADVSLVALGSDETALWIEPAPTCFDHPLERMVGLMARWIHGGAPSAGPGEITRLPARWMAGGTLGPCPEPD